MNYYINNFNYSVGGTEFKFLHFTSTTFLIKLELKCKFCNISFYREKHYIQSALKGSKNKLDYCSKSCAIKHRNLFVKVGSNRSKLELWTETKLSEIFPNLKILYNNRTIIKPYELDIYIPSLKLAFELNGNYHYEPIHGYNRLLQCQYNDKITFKKCQELKISLCIIDTRDINIFRINQPKQNKKCYEFLSIITNIINNNLELSN